MALRMIWSVTKVFSGAGLLGGLVLGGVFPLILLPLALVSPLFGQEAELGTLLLISVVGAITGAVVGLAVGVLVGLASSVITWVAFREQIGSSAHRRVIRGVSVVIAAALMFSGVGVATNSYDMSATTILWWRLPTSLVAALYGWWLAGRMVNNDGLWRSEGKVANDWDEPMKRGWENTHQGAFLKNFS